MAEADGERRARAVFNSKSDIDEDIILPELLSQSDDDDGSGSDM